MKLSDLTKSISDMSTDELQSLLLEIRTRRRNPPKPEAAPKKDKSLDKLKDLSPEALQALLSLLTSEGGSDDDTAGE